MSGRNTAFEVTNSSLQMLQTASQFVPIPALNMALTTATQILKIAQKAVTNKEEFLSIGTRSCEVVSIVIDRALREPRPGETPNYRKLNEDCQSLLDDLEGILRHVKKYNKRKSWFIRFMRFQLDADIIKECNQLLDHALKIFDLKSNIDIRQTLSDIQQIVEDLRQRVAQGQASPAPMQPPPAFPTPVVNEEADRDRIRREKQERQRPPQQNGPNPSQPYSSHVPHQPGLSNHGNITHYHGPFTQSWSDNSIKVSGADNKIEFHRW